ncbi:MAG: hypothetical protein JOZ96_14285 [Acidobacteria bacterium]|nr:hypothetical protein [Acidobacteriota bacterium]
MLFIQSNSLALSLDEGGRLRLLEALAARGFEPLVRSARREVFRALGGEASAAELERLCAARAGASGKGAYTPGELFAGGDCLLSLVFEAEGETAAGVVYDLDTAAPLARLERFCRDVQDALGSMRAEENVAVQSSESQAVLPLWRPRSRTAQQGLARFTAIQPEEFVRAAAALRGGKELARASELLEGHAVRDFLKRIEELRREGYTPRRMLAEAGAQGGVSVERLVEAGLLEREIRVSCRKHGHALFDLPSPDSLAAVTISRAKCSLCAAPVADEVVEETFSPSRLAVALLADGGWLAHRVYRIVRSLGVPESDISTGPPTPHGESFLAADVSGSSFIFVSRDGDLTPAFARRAAEIVEETEATHLVAVVTGAAEDEGRLRLYEFAWRRARGGHDLDTTVVEGLDRARGEFERAFARAARRELSRALFPLDAALGFPAAAFALEWFRVTKSNAGRDSLSKLSA